MHYRISSNAFRGNYSFQVHSDCDYKSRATAIELDLEWVIVDD